VRKIVVSQFVSVDGVIEDPLGIEELGRGAWSSRFDSGDEGQAAKVDEMMQSDAMLMGRRTYVVSGTLDDAAAGLPDRRRGRQAELRRPRSRGWTEARGLQAGRIGRCCPSDLRADGRPEARDRAENPRIRR
jgi:hypothetical protein